MPVGVNVCSSSWAAAQTKVSDEQRAGSCLTTGFPNISGPERHMPKRQDPNRVASSKEAWKAPLPCSGMVPAPVVDTLLALF